MDLVSFSDKQIRRKWDAHEEQWYFSVTDIIEALTDSSNSRDYWYKMKIRVKTEAGVELSTFCRQLKLQSSDGKFYETDCASTESIFRIIQSIPSPKAEPFKLWLAKVGYERVEESVDPVISSTLHLGLLSTNCSLLILHCAFCRSPATTPIIAALSPVNFLE
jgi:DNA-damage-inducible protein D